MKRPAFAAAALGVVATVALSLLPAASAGARMLPPGDDMFTLTSFNDHIVLFSVYQDTAEVAPVGEWDPDAFPYDEESPGFEGLSITATAWDATTATAYFVARYDLYDGANGGHAWAETYLGAVDLQTGEPHFIGQLAVGTDTYATGLAIGADSDAYVIMVDDVSEVYEEDSSARLYGLDLETGALHLVGHGDEAAPMAQAFTYNPQIDEFVAAGIFGGGYRVDVTTGEFSPSGVVPLEEAESDTFRLTALQADSSGLPWLVIQNGDDDGESLLVQPVVDGESIELSVVGPFKMWPAEEPEGFDIRSATLIITTGTADPGRATSTGAQLFAIATDDQYNGLQLFRVDPFTGLAAPVGSGNGSQNNIDDDDYSAAYQPAYDPVTKTVYFIEHSNVDASGGEDYLTRLNPTTGASSRVGHFSYNGDENVDLDSIAIASDGAAFAFAWYDDESYGLFRLNLANAHLTLVGAPQESSFRAFAADPTSGELYAIDAEQPILYRVDAETAALTSLGWIEFQDEDGEGALSLQIDEDGTFWVINQARLDLDGDGPESERQVAYLNTFTLPQGQAETIEAAQVGVLWDDPFFATGLLLLPTAATAPAAGPGLALTGIDAAPYLIVGGTLLLLGGVALAFSLRRRRHAVR